MLLLRTELKETLVQDEGLPVVNYNGKLPTRLYIVKKGCNIT